MEVLLVLAMLGVPMAVVIGIGKWILDPFEAAARRYRRPTQFTIADFLSLMFLLQLPMGAVHSLLADVSREPKLILDAAGWVICSLMWGLSVKKLSCAGIKRPRHRLVFLALVLPITYFGTFAFVILGAICIRCILNGPPSGLWGPALLVIELTFIVTFWLSARFVRVMVAATKPQTQAVHVQIDDGRGVERQHLAENQPAHNGDAQRPA